MSDKLSILVVGGGGREHAIVKKLSESKRAGKIYAAPGNAGIAKLAECINYKADDIEGITTFAATNKIDLVFVAPDDPLTLGMVDRLDELGIRAFGPVKAAAQLEGSKVFSKSLMKKYSIPTADYEIFDEPHNALSYIRQRDVYPVVVKADGLALGKGAIIAGNYEDAEKAVKSIMEDKIFGASGNKIVIEEFMTGSEVTVLSFTDGKTVVPMVSSQDHKRAYDNDIGPNTGGMGAFSPSRVYNEVMAEHCMNRIFMPTINALNSEGITFKGVIYFQLMLTKDEAKVVEYNARFGDPETQVVLPKLKTDFIDIIDAVIDCKLSDINIEWNDMASACVVMASGGYPIKYEKGFEITGLDSFDNCDDVYIYHAGTKYSDNKIVTAGGRVLNVTALAPTLDEAIAKAYESVKKISFKDAHYRHDIGLK